MEPATFSSSPNGTMVVFGALFTIFWLYLVVQGYPVSHGDIGSSSTHNADNIISAVPAIVAIFGVFVSIVGFWPLSSFNIVIAVMTLLVAIYDLWVLGGAAAIGTPLLLGSNRARAALAPDLAALVAQCGIATQGAGKIPFICFDLAGGASQAGSNVLVGQRGGQLDFLTTEGYSRQGLPAANTPSGTSRVTTLPAPITERAPTRTPGQRIAPPPTHTSEPISTGRANSSPVRRCSALRGWVAV